MTKLNDYILFRKSSESERLVVFFSDAGSKNFTGFDLLKDLPVNQLFVRDPNRSWYNEGVEGAWNDIEHLISILKTYTDQFKAEDITFIGGSMGGYASMLFGSLLNIGQVLAFSPQIMLDHRLPNNPSERIKLKYPNLYDEVSKNNYTKFCIYIGSEDLEDIYNIYPSHLYENITVYCINGAPHNAMSYLHKMSILSTLMTNFILYRRPAIPLSLFSIWDNTDTLNEISQLIESHYFLNNVNDIIIQLSFANPHWVILQEWLGLYYAKTGDHRLALEAYSKVLGTKGDITGELYFKMGESAVQIQELTQAESYFNQSICFGLASKLSLYTSKLGAVKMLKGEYIEAIELQEKALSFNSKNSLAFYQLGLVYLKLKQYQQSVYYFNKAISYGNASSLTKKHLKTALNNLKSNEIVVG